MKKVAKKVVTTLVVLCVFLALPISANAATTVSQDGLEISIVTDKDEYSANEDIQVSVNIKNTNSYRIEDVSVDTILPEGLELKTGNLDVEKFDIDAGATYSTVVVSRLSRSGGGGVTTPEGNSDPKEPTIKETTSQEDKTTTPSATTKVDNSNGTQDTTSPLTGDTSNLILLVVLLVVSGAVVVIAVKYKKSAKIISFVLCVAMGISMMPMNVLAAENNNTTITVDKTITVNEETYTISATVSIKKISNPHVELSEFKASVFDIYINTTETVLFTVKVNSDSSITDTVNLIENETIIAEMYDNGNNGDLVANDGIYSVRIDLLKNETQNIDYYATYLGYNSNTFELCYYRDLTEDDLVSYSKLLDMINSLPFTDAKEYVKSSSEITNFIIDDKNQTITYKTIYGISGVWEEIGTIIKGNGEYAVNQPEGLDYNTIYNECRRARDTDTDPILPEYPTITEYDYAKSLVSSVNIESSYLNKNTVVLRPFRNSQFKYDDFSQAGEVISEALDGSLTVIDDENVTLSVMKSLDEYGVVLIDSHGGLTELYNKTYIVTGETFSETRFLLDPIYYATHVGYSADYFADRIFGTGANRAGVSSKFFDKYYSDNSLNGAFWYLGNCYGCYNDSIPNSIIGKGASAVLGFSNTVSVGYCNNVLFETIINSMILSSESLSESIENAKRSFGDCDPITMGLSDTYTTIEYKGSPSFKLVNCISATKGTLSGKICKASDRVTAISNASIEVYKDNSLYTSSTSNSSGNYSIDLPAGKYLVKISSDGYIDFKSYATVTDNENTYMETFLLIEGSETETGIASGKVINSLTGNGTSSVTLTVKRDWNNFNESDEVVKSTITNENGNYYIELPLGNYTVTATKDGYTPSSFNIIVQQGETGNQNGTITPIISGDNYLITLTWGENPSDLDSHVVGNLSDGSSFHVYYKYKSAYDDGVEVCNLDYDDISSYGPEHITLNTTTDNPYYYYIYKYGGNGTVTSSEAKITVEQDNNLIAEFNVPTDLGNEDYWNVFAIKNGKLIVSNSITSSPELEYAN